MGFIKKIYILSLLSVLIFWFFIGVARLFFNTTRMFTTEREWLFMSDDEKRTRLLGQEHIFLKHVQKITPKDAVIQVYIPSQDILPGIFYKTIYYLYPRELSFEASTVLIHSKRADYLVSYAKEKNNFVLISAVTKKYEYKIGKIWAQLYKYE